MDPPSDHSFPSGKVQQRFTSIPWGNPCGSNSYPVSSDASLFSSSLPDFSNAKWNLTTLEHRVQSINDASLELSEYRDAECKDSVDDLDIEGIGSRLPGDEDELLAGIIDELHLSHLPCQVEDLEECDVFSSGGGMELESDPTESITLGMSKTNINDCYAGNGNVNHGLRNCVGSVAGEHPHGEHPSRTLFVRNINSNVEDSELLSLFEQYGKIRSLYTACKHRGFVMISYYDIRDARNAMKALQNKPLRRRKLDIHFSIPKDNPSDKDLNQGTLVIFNLDPSVSNDDLLRIFGVYGEVKEIRETPHKRHHKFIEYYDVRAAEAACRSLNRSDIAGKRIKLEPSRPGGTRRKQSGTELEQDEARGYMHQVGSPLSNSPPGRWADIGSPSDSSLQAHSHFSTVGSSRLLPGLASISPSMISNPSQKLVIGKDQGQVNHVNHLLSNNNHMWNISSGSQNTQPFVSQTSDASVAGVLTGSQFLWGSPTFSEHARTAGRAEWPIGCPFTSIPHQQAFTCSNHGRIPHPSPYYHVGSAPPGLPFERHFGHLPAESLEASFMNQVAFGTMTNMWDDSRINMSISSGPPRHPGVPLSRAISENHSAGYKLVSSQKYDNVFLRNHSLCVPGSIGFDASLECNQCWHVDNNGKLDGKTQYQLDLEKIKSGEDTRTTIMIKNIPNKYTSNMLLAAIDESSKGTYDFFYLPIDFKNRCNMGYAFINMLSSSDIIPLYQAFDGKKWEKFNSEKVASLAYARIQGKTALVNHFQYSSLMNEDKRCRPILFHHGAVEAGDKERCPRSGINICIHRQEGTCLTDLPENQVKDVQNQKPETSNSAGIGSGERQRGNHHGMQGGYISTLS